MEKRCLKNILIGLFAVGTLIFPVQLGYTQYPGIYQHYLDRAKEAIRKEDYRSALLFLETAQSVQPESPEVLQYLNVVTHALQQRIQPLEPAAVKTTETQVVYRPSPELNIPARLSEPISTPSREFPRNEARTASIPMVQPQLPSQTVSPAAAVVSDSPTAPLTPSNSAALPERERIIFELNDEAWKAQPDMEIELGLDQELLMHGRNIARYLVVASDVVHVVRQANREILIVPKMYGQTFVHVWDEQQRWTFYIKTVFPTQREDDLARTMIVRQRSVDPFRFGYRTNWNAYYSGPSVSGLDRQSYNWRHFLDMRGPSPYGDLDTYAVFYETNRDVIDLTDYSMGLTGAKWRDIKDVHIRIFDASRYLSALTMPGRDFRGALISGKTVDDKFSFTALRGQDRATFGLLSSRTADSLDSYIEAGKVSYQPNEQQTLSLNYAHAWGEDKQPTAKDRVYSAEFDQRLDDWNLYSEAAYDQDESAQIVWSRHYFDNGTFSIKGRNIPRDYATVVGSTGNQGEIGTEFSLAHKMGDSNLNHYLDLYRDRDNKNPNDEDAINIDFNSIISNQLSERDLVSGSFYVIHTPGTLADRTDFRIAGTFGHRMDIFLFSDAILSLTASHQRSRSDPSPSVDYDRSGLMANLHVPINRFFNYNTSYEMYHVHDIVTAEDYYPRAFNTGLFYHQALSDKWRVNAQAYYRDEQKTEAEKSFMAGQDSLSLGSGIDFSPYGGMNFYLDGRVREIWAQNSRTESYVEADVRLGMRSEWDLGFTWNPQGIIQGYVFRDLNNNAIKDPQEPGIPGVGVRIGESEQATTDATGWYYKKIKAKSVQVSLDINTIPKGYIFMDSADKVFDIEHNGFYDGSFALTTQSGIYGVVYHDKNNNSRPDNGDEFLYKVRLTLDNDMRAQTDPKGTYFFYNISEGGHVLSLDLSSLPGQYLPKVPLTNTIVVADGAMYIFHIPVIEK